MKTSGTRLTSSAAFTLVEVALSMGLASFCLVAVMGLVPLGVDTTQMASDQTAASSILTHVLADLRATPRPPSTAPAGAPAVSSEYLLQIPPNPVPANGTTATLYFGNTLQQFSASPSLIGSRYRLTVNFLPPNLSDGTKAPTRVTALVTWPSQINPADPRTGTPTGRVQTFAALDRN